MNRRKIKTYPYFSSIIAQERLGFLIALAGGPRGIRTPDLLNAIETRSQLRYGPGLMNDFPVEQCSVIDYRALDLVTEQVDLRGFEPLTSSVRLRRAPNCATGP